MSSGNPTSEAPPPASPTPWGTRIVLVLLAAVAVPAGATLLFNFAPTEYTFYPPCLFRWATGLNCPGCGATRCVAALLHGNIEQALAYNAVLVILFPLLIYGGVRVAIQMWTGKRAPGYDMPVWAMRILLVILIAYGVARNIPIYPFSVLAPHAI